MVLTLYRIFSSLQQEIFTTVVRTERDFTVTEFDTMENRSQQEVKEGQG